MRSGLQAFFLTTLLLLQPIAVRAATFETCDEERTHLLSLLRSAASKVRVRTAEVENLSILSPETLKAFTQDGDWLIAWLQDQSERLEEKKEDCSTLPALRKDAVAQILPVERASRKIFATTLVWQLDQVSQNVREENTIFVMRVPQE